MNPMDSTSPNAQPEAKPGDVQAEAKPADALAEAKPADAPAEPKPAVAQAEAKPDEHLAEPRPAGAPPVPKPVDAAASSTPVAPAPVRAAPPAAPRVPLIRRIRTYLDHGYSHDGSLTAATHAFVISWLVVFSLLLLVVEGAPEFRTFSDGVEATPTEEVEPTATPELLVQVRSLIQEEISRSRAMGTGVSELPTVTPQPTAEPTATPTAEEETAAAEVTRDPWFAMPIEAEDGIHFGFVIFEGIVAALFTIDYALNVRYEKRARDYILGFWGIIDLIAILPFFAVLAGYLGLMGEGELPPWVVFLQGLRILRAIKLFRIVSDTKTENSLGEVIEGNTLHRDVMFGFLVVFGAVAVLEVFGWTAERHLWWLVIGMLSAFTVAIRRWCMHVERGGLSALLVVTSLIFGTAMSVAQDRAGDPLVAEWTAVYTVLFVVASWLQIEAKEGAL